MALKVRVFMKNINKLLVISVILTLFALFAYATVNSVSLGTPSDLSWTSNPTPTFNFSSISSINDTLICELFVDGNGYFRNETTLNNTWTYVTPNTTLANGTHTWYVNCTDSENSLLSSTITLYVDTANPVSSITSPSNNSWTTDTTPELLITITDNLGNPINYVVYANGVSRASGTVANGTSTSVNLSALSQGVYIINVQATDNASNVANSSTWTLKVDTTAPTLTSFSPSNASTVNDSSVTLSFTAVDNLDTNLNYTIYINGTANSTGFATNNTAKTTAISFANGSTYLWYVTAKDNASNSVTSGVYRFTVADTSGPSSAPTLVSAGVNDSDVDGNIEIGWAADVNAVSYKLYRQTTNITNITGSALATVTGTSFEDNTSVNGTTYWYALRSVDSDGNEGTGVSSSFFALSNDSFYPQMPAAVSAVTNDDGSVAVNWSTVLYDINGNADGVTYYLFRTLDMGTLDLSNRSQAINSTTGTSYTDSNATTNVAYTYVVTVIDDAAHYNSTNGTRVAVTPEECDTTFTYGSWSSCSGGTRTRTGTRTCYGGGDTTSTQSDSCGSSGGGGSSSSSGSSTSTSTNPKTSQGWMSVDSESPVHMEIKNTDFGVTSIDVHVTGESKNVMISVEKLPDKPASVTQEIKGKVYKYLKIDKSNLPDANIGSGTVIKFKVDKQWLSLNGLNEDSIVLMRYTTSWKALSTKKVSSDGNNVYYSAETPGFSYFAISQKDSSPVTPAPTTEEPPVQPPAEPEAQPLQETPPVETVPEETSENPWMWTILGVLGVLIVGGGVFFFYTKHKGTKEEEKHESSLETTETHHKRK